MVIVIGVKREFPQESDWYKLSPDRRIPPEVEQQLRNQNIIPIGIIVKDPTNVPRTE